MCGDRNCFHETFHDDGKTDMYEAMKAYYEIGFDRIVRPDHVPTLIGEDSKTKLWRSGQLFCSWLHQSTDGSRQKRNQQILKMKKEIIAMKFDNREDILQITPLWKGERFEDGRPKVPDDILRRMRNITLEEAWGPLWREGYKFQFEGDLKRTHEKVKLVGRAVTSVMVPMRPDLHNALLEYGQKEEGRNGFFNQWVVDSLTEDDVVVVDLFDKVYEGTYVGGNLSTAIAARTKRGGAIIWGGIRDNEQIVEIPNIQVYYRGVDPTAIANVTMTGFNVPARIGNAICLPGDVVLGTISGVIFIPAHLAETVVVEAEKSHIKDVFGFQRLEERIYTTAQIDSRWSIEMFEDFMQWLKTDEKAKEYTHLDWSPDRKELEQWHAEHPDGGTEVTL
ncbi:mannonate dehydratase [Massilimaliae timonensis]|uniref:Mannonate dehydratase n=1 Tax=Massiliimalia timonensis TaxID=1987501 RepID=A0A8J6PBY6_9FIRM|nr:mannonate dehydratase [Massiliimalia timonensis]